LNDGFSRDMSVTDSEREEAMAVKKREWTTPKGETRIAWVAESFDNRDGKQKRSIKTFRTKKEADAYAAKTKVDTAAGIHVPDSASITVKQAAKDWLAAAEEVGLERSTTTQYRQHVDLHIVPLIGRVKLSQLTTARVRAFETSLREKGCSEAMVKKIVTSLSGMLSEARVRGNIASNPVRDLRRRKAGRGAAREKRHKEKLTVGIHIPTPDEVRLITQHAEPGRWRTLVMMAALTGMRASDLRGLDWGSVDFDAREVAVVQRADRYGVIGPPKSAAGRRRLPLTPLLVNMLREWKVQSGGTGLVFGTRTGKPASHPNIATRCLNPAQIAAGLGRPMLDPAGQPLLDEDGAARLAGKYGMHAFRHFCASWLINPRSAGGLEQPVKVVQERLGHETINITLDLYAHLFPRGDDHAELAAGEQAIFGELHAT
jgi:integrase